MAYWDISILEYILFFSICLEPSFFGLQTCVKCLVDSDRFCLGGMNSLFSTAIQIGEQIFFLIFLSSYFRPFKTLTTYPYLKI